MPVRESLCTLGRKLDKPENGSGCSGKKKTLTYLESNCSHPASGVILVHSELPHVIKFNLDQVNFLH
jgi:hypothetical protein